MPGEVTSPKWAQAFANGCHGTVVSDLELRPGPFAAFPTPPLWAALKRARAEGRQIYYGDHGYWRRGQYYRVFRNAYQYRVTDADIQAATPRRFQLMRAPLAEAWETSGSSVVICPNSPAYMAQYGVNAEAWILDIITRLNAVTDRPIIVRWKKHASTRPLYVDLHTAWMVITFSSASAIDALTAGIPICTLAPWATSAPMGITRVDDVERPYYPDDRIPFLWALAARQWTLSEFSTGLAWRQLNADA